MPPRNSTFFSILVNNHSVAQKYVFSLGCIRAFSRLRSRRCMKPLPHRSHRVTFKTPNTSEERHPCEWQGVITMSPPVVIRGELPAALRRPLPPPLFFADVWAQVIAEPGRYLVEASHVLFARIYAKRRLTLRGAPRASGYISFCFLYHKQPP